MSSRLHALEGKVVYILVEVEGLLLGKIDVGCDIVHINRAGRGYRFNYTLIKTTASYNSTRRTSFVSAKTLDQHQSGSVECARH